MGNGREEINVCEVIAKVLQRIKDIEEEQIHAGDLVELRDLKSRRDELVMLCKALGWDKYL